MKLKCLEMWLLEIREIKVSQKFHVKFDFFYKLKNTRSKREETEVMGHSAVKLLTL